MTSKSTIPIDYLFDGYAYHRVVTDAEGVPIDFVFLHVNRAFEEMTGMSSETTIGHKATDLFPDIHTSAFDWIATYGQVALTGETKRFEQYSELLGRWYAITAFSDRPGFFGTVFRDITTTKTDAHAKQARSTGGNRTRREQLEVELSESRQYVQSILDVVPDIVCRFDAEGTLLDVFTSDDKKLLLPREQAIGKRLTDIFPKDTALQALQCIQAVLVTGTPRTMEYMLRIGAKDCWFVAHFIRQTPHEVVVLIMDTTQQTEALAALAKSQTQYKLLLDQLSDGLYVHDEHGQIRDVNRAAVTMTGYAREELLRLTVFDLHPDSCVRDDILAQWQRWRPDDPPVTIQHCHRRKDGRCVPVEISAKKAVLDNEWVILALVRDTSDRQAAIEAQKQYVQRQAIAARLASDFLQTPLNRIDRSIGHSLQIVGQSFDADRCYLFRLSEDHQLLTCTHEWCAQGIPKTSEELQRMEIDALPVFRRLLLSKREFCVSHIDELPPDAEAERCAFQKQSIQAMLGIPLVIGQQVKGLMSINFITPRTFDESDRNLLQTVGSIIASALERSEAEARLTYLSFHDALTGLNNRTYADIQLQELDTPGNLPLSVITADLNDLKLVNDS